MAKIKLSVYKEAENESVLVLVNRPHARDSEPPIEDERFVLNKGDSRVLDLEINQYVTISQAG